MAMALGSVYTVCDESRYLIVKNVPALGCIDELVKLFGLYGPIEEYRLLDEEECEPFTDVYWIKFVKISNARFAKRKLDDYKFLGNLLQVTYAPECESPLDTKDKLEERRSVVLSRINSEKRKGSKQQPVQHTSQMDPLLVPTTPENGFQHSLQSNIASLGDPGQHTSTPNEDMQKSRFSNSGALSYPYFPSKSMNATAESVRQKLHQISSIGVAPGLSATHDTHSKASTMFNEKQSDGRQYGPVSIVEKKPAEKKPRLDNRRRI